MSKFDDWSLTKYTAEVFLGVLKVDSSSTTKKTTRKAVSVFQEWYGGETSIGDITPQVLADMQKAKGTGPVKNYHITIMQHLMRTAAPDRFLKPHAVKIKQPSGMDGPTYLLAAFYAELYLPAVLRSRRPRTKDLYRATLIQFEKFLERPPTLDDLDNETVGRFASFRLAKGLSKHTVNKDLFNILAIWRWANRKNYVQEWPDVQMEKAPARVPEAWTKEELARLFRSASKEEGRIGCVPSGAWWVTLLLAIWDTGERINAIMGLCWTDVDFEWGGLKFVAENRKGAHSDNLRAVAKDTIVKLKYLKRRQESAEMYDPDGLVFLFPHNNATLYNRFSRILKRAELPFDSRCKFHRMRRSVASHFEQAGGNATELLGHSKREVTLAYLDPKIVKRVEAVDLLFRPNGEPLPRGSKTRHRICCDAGDAKAKRRKPK